MENPWLSAAAAEEGGEIVANGVVALSDPFRAVPTGGGVLSVLGDLQMLQNAQTEAEGQMGKARNLRPHMTNAAESTRLAGDPDWGVEDVGRGRWRG
jgi:hypothetical protein